VAAPLLFVQGFHSPAIWWVATLSRFHNGNEPAGRTLVL
jgi:hypothetical protein